MSCRPSTYLSYSIIFVLLTKPNVYETTLLPVLCNSICCIHHYEPRAKRRREQRWHLARNQRDAGCEREQCCCHHRASEYFPNKIEQCQHRCFKAAVGFG